jgi:DNA phosphorothioation-dependent restriction protein DptH
VGVTFTDLRQDQLNAALEAILIPDLVALLQTRAAGHCMRVTDLDLELMIALCRALQRQLPDVNSYILGAPADEEQDKTLFISSTKLVELRNPDAEGLLRPPLLVFVPANLRTSAEDSFGIATFEEIDITNVYQKLNQQLVARLPTAVQSIVKELFTELSNARWFWANIEARTRFLLRATTDQPVHEMLGAALYELGLVPDLTIFSEGSFTLGRIRRNCEAVQALTNADRSIRGRVLDLDLTDRTLQRRLMQLLLELGVDDPRQWCKQIAIERRNVDLTFDKWRFTDERTPDQIQIANVRTDLPIVEDEEDPRYQGLVGQQVLAPQSRRKITVTFRVDPHPTQVSGLDHFTVQIMAREGSHQDTASPVGTAKKVKSWKATRSTCSVALDKLNKIEFDPEGGWHFIRVLAWTADGDPIPLATKDSKEAYLFDPLPGNESEPFFVLPGGETFTEEIQQRAVPRAESLEHARLRLQCKAVREVRKPEAVRTDFVSWTEKDTKAKISQRNMLSLKFGNDGSFQVPVIGQLQQLEEKILTTAESLMLWQIEVDKGKAMLLDPVQLSWPKTSLIIPFITARKRYLEAIAVGEAKLISQAADFNKLGPLCLEYARTYQDLLLELYRLVESDSLQERIQAINDLQNLLLLDTVEVTLINYRNRSVTRNLALISPTHPLRALWLATWTTVGQQWIAATQDGPKEYIAFVEDALLRRLLPLNLPAALARPQASVYMMVDNINSFWSVYAPATEVDTRGSFSELCTALNVPETRINSNEITGELVAQRIERYLVQHPYIRVLSINIFNPGRATMIGEVLTQLQKISLFSDLRYDLRLFVPDPEAPGIGDAIIELLSPSAAVSTEEMDAFSASTGSHLFPKLSIAIRSITEFTKTPENYHSHLSLLLDLFPAAEVGAEPAFIAHQTAPLHGLLQDFSNQYNEQNDDWLWRRQPQHGSPTPIYSAQTFVELLTGLSGTISGTIATVATGKAVLSYRPVITVSLSPEQRQMLHRVHEISDWVYTIDRNLGIEFYDHGRSDRPHYLIDYVPGKLINSGHRLVITTRSRIELESLIGPLLNEYGLPAQSQHVHVILQQLRTLSGRLTLKLISSAATQRAEALGLALSFLFLKHQKALYNQILVPLDDHLDLFRKSEGEISDSEETATLRRTDLALFELDHKRRTIVCRLIEVKCYAQTEGLRAYTQLKAKIAEQIYSGEEVLGRHFDPYNKKPDRPDRLLKTRELTLLLEFYLERGYRHGIISEQSAEESRTFLRSLEAGYYFEFTRSALIFDFTKTGTEKPDYEQGVECYRIGYDLIRALVLGATQITERTEEEIKSLSETNIPLLKTSAFLSSNHSVVLDGTVLNTYANDLQDPLEQDSISVPIVYPTALVDKEATPPETIVTAIREITRPPHYDVLVGSENASPQYGILGEVAGRRVALDLNETHTISLFGVQGSGKSYTLGSLIEMACLPIANINQLVRPFATVLFHYSATKEYKPEFVSMIHPNLVATQIAVLQEQYKAEPDALRNVIIVTPKLQVEQRKREFPEIPVYPLTFSSKELKASHWKFLLAAVGNQSLYLKQVNQIIRKLGDDLSLESLHSAIEQSRMTNKAKETAYERLQLASDYIDDSNFLSNLVEPGRLIVVDLRDETIEKDDALGLFVVLLQIFSEATYQGRSFNKLVVFDEAHKYIKNEGLVEGLIEVVREMRHWGTSILVASQEPRSVPQSLIELSTEIILHRFNSPEWLRYIQKTNTALNSLTPEKMNSLGAGEAYLWSSKSNDKSFSTGAIKVHCRPRVTQHGGATKTAVMP